MKIQFNSITQPYRCVNKIMSKINNNKMISKALPMVSIPLVSYYIGENSDNALKNLISDMKANNISIPNYSHDPNTHSGLDFASQGRFRNAIENANIDEDTKKDLLNQVTFTGKNDDYSIYSGGSSSSSSSESDDSCDCDSDDCCDSDCDSDDCLSACSY